MAKIQLLDQHVAELIAAGEVVERPSAVVKELLENAIDAGATQVSVAIESGGIRLIEICDNGSGIETEYIGNAFVRHATSKIQNEDDLLCIATLGFRGEALASIASVARVEVLTKTEEDEFACSYRIEGGQALGMEISARAVGTTIRVRDLFYNTPARMKFLKKDASEGTFVADLVGHVALSHPEISFKFIREGKLQYVTPGDGDLQSAAYAVLGREFARDLVKVNDASGCYTVTGYVSPPKNCRASRSMQYFYINGRYIRNRTMMAGLETAYKGTLMHGKFPGCVLSMQMPHDMIDVNVHPSKTEVRFAREKDVFEAVYRAVKAALSNAAGEDMRTLTLRPPVGASRPVHQPTQASVSSTPVGTGRGVVTPHPIAQTNVSQGGASRVSAGVAQAVSAPRTPAVTVVKSDAPIAPRAQIHSAFADAPAAGLEAAYQHEVGEIAGMKPTFAPTKMSDDVLGDIGRPAQDNCFTPVESEAIAPTAPEPMAMPAFQQEIAADTATEQTSFYPDDEIEPLRYVGEAFKTYILAQRGDELYLIDKHAAHERILYEDLAAGYGKVDCQMLMQAVAVNLCAAEKQALLENIDLLEQAGFEVDDFGGTTVLVRAVPADVPASDIEGLTVELAAKLAQGSLDAMNEKTEWVLHSIACRAAIKGGDISDAKQLLHLAQLILAGEIPPYCPHGRPCVITLTRKELEKQFGRIVS